MLRVATPPPPLGQQRIFVPLRVFRLRILHFHQSVAAAFDRAIQLLDHAKLGQKASRGDE
jgi:hypothetical protein